MLPPRELPPCDLLPPLLDLLELLLDLLELLRVLKLELREELELLRDPLKLLREELELLRDVLALPREPLKLLRLLPLERPPSADLALRWLPTLLLEDDELPLKELPTELEAFG